MRGAMGRSRCEMALSFGRQPRRGGPSGTAVRSLALIGMFFFFSNGVGLTASIVISILGSLLLLYACTGP
jgi:hypothetical protein